jgi:hemoglobin-like flavoprotein
MPMTEASLLRITANYETLADRMPELASAFYDRLFEVLPQSRALFKIDIALQSQHLAAALALIVRNLRFMDALEQPLRELGVHHARVGVRPEQYPIVCRAMIDTIQAGSGARWSPQLESDWSAALEVVSRVMMEGAFAEAATRLNRSSASS